MFRLSPEIFNALYIILSLHKISPMIDAEMVEAANIEKITASIIIKIYNKIKLTSLFEQELSYPISRFSPCRHRFCRLVSADKKPEPYLTRLCLLLPSELRRNKLHPVQQCLEGAYRCSDFQQ